MDEKAVNAFEYLAKTDVGISTPEQAKKLANLSDGVVIGSDIIKLLGKYRKHAPKYVGEYVKSVKNAIK